MGKETTEKETKKAFRKMAMSWHPDKFVNKSDEEKAASEKIGEVYKVSKDAKLERYYSDVDIDWLKRGEGFGDSQAGGGGPAGRGGRPEGGRCGGSQDARRPKTQETM